LLVGVVVAVNDTPTDQGVVVEQVDIKHLRRFR